MLYQPPLWYQTIDAQLATAFAFRYTFHDSLFYSTIISAEPFGWNRESVVAVTEAAKSIPNDAQLHWNLNTKRIWWWFEEPISTAEGLIRAFCGAWLKDLNVFCLKMTNDSSKSALSTYLIWEENETISQCLNKIEKENDRKTTESICKFLLAALAWLNQKILITETAHVERHQRKRYQKQTGRIPIVRIVLLRKQERPHSTQSYQGYAPASYSHRFIVNGHWRNQAYGANWQFRRLKFIMPFVKGPEDKPFIEKIKVNEVVR